MTDAPVHLSGQVASEGLAIGPLCVLRDSIDHRREPGDTDDEVALLTRAIAAAAADLDALIAAQGDEDAAAILEFQREMLGDAALAAPAFADIAAGAPADRAWEQAMAVQIEIYTEEEDDYFRARAIDLTDLKDRVLRRMVVAADADIVAPDGAVLFGDDLSPSRFLSLDWSRYGGVALAAGSTAGHVAMLARARRVPMVVGLGAAAAADGAMALLDAEAGALILRPSPDQLRAAEDRRAAEARRREDEDRYLPLPARTADGVDIAVMINVEAPDTLGAIDPGHCDGIGLVRTEFLFYRDEGLPDEAAQFAAYTAFLDWAGDRPVTIRTLDAGGDKPILGLTRDGEDNPFLGVRGLRLSLRRPDVFRVQLRALARAAGHGNLKVMFPMVTVPDEFEAARASFREVVDDLRAEGIEAALPALGIMVEVPAAALRIADFDADFFSIGSNDLTQYVTACSRGEPELAALFDPLDPAVLELIARVVAHGRDAGREVSLCGDMAGEPRCLDALLRCGLRTLSVAPGRLAATKAAIAAVEAP